MEGFSRRDGVQFQPVIVARNRANHASASSIPRSPRSAFPLEARAATLEA